MTRNNSQSTTCCSFCDASEKEAERLFRTGPTMICDACVDEAVVAKKKGTLQTNIGAPCSCRFCDEVTPSAFVRQIDDEPLPPAVCEACIDVLAEQLGEVREEQALKEALCNPISQKQPLTMFFRQAAVIFKEKGLPYHLAAQFLSRDLDVVGQVYEPKQRIRSTKISPPTDTEHLMAVLLLKTGGMKGISAEAVLTRQAVRPARPKPQTEDVAPRALRVHAR